jgi:cysteine desulfurase/selenocysteine lyase
LGSIGFDALLSHEQAMLSYATPLLAAVPGLRIIGTAREKTGILSFVLEGMHPHDIGTILDKEGVAIRAGHHCTMPLMERFGVPATARASFALYNTRQEVDALVAAVCKAQEVFK